MMKKLKICCNRDPNFKNVVTADMYENGNTDRNSWWFLDGELERECGYDKGTVYNLSEYPELRKETLFWKWVTGDIAEVWDYQKHYEMHANGEFEVEMYGVKEECVGIFWTTCERLVKTERGISFPVWNQRGLVCLKTDTEAIERARQKRLLKEDIL